MPAVKSEALFGPNLSQLKAKLGQTKGDMKSARVWLIQWILDPHKHSPRSRMPVTLTQPIERPSAKEPGKFEKISPEHQAADIAAWLLAQTPKDFGAEWADLQVPEPDEKTLKELARVYLVHGA